MGVTRVRRVQARKKKDLETALKFIVAPPVIVGTLIFGKRRRR